ncbi:MAG: endo-1,4-beta-xylanase, partial [Muribaculaceae bacterium]|nr:endo-1,4-beta-xylanase [Muribaculaceae bacterium]
MNFDKVRSFVDAAKAVNMQIYGHTLCWHSQQNAKYLNSLLADKELEIDPDAKNEVVDFELDFSSLSEYNYWHQSPDATVFSIEDGCLKIENPEAVGFWEVQYFTFDNVILQKGVEYQLTVELKATAEGAVQGNVGGWGDNAGIRIPYTTDWETKTITFTSATDEITHGLFQTGDLVGTIWYKSIKISHAEAPAMEIGISLMNGGDADNGQSANLIAREKGNDDIPARIVDDPAGTGKVFECTYNDNPTNPWDSQFFITSNEPLEAGTKIHVKFRYRATDERSIETQAHAAPGDYHHYQFIGTLNATTDWKEHEYTGVISGDQAGSNGCSSIAFNLCSGTSAGTFYIDDVVFEKIISANTIPLTPEEKKDVLTAEMERWVKGMMDATGGYVKAWDVVNEAISGGPWGQRYDLQHAGDNPNDFFWQDYLGDDFVRVPVKFARQYFAENGGNPDELKLFVNDYNLESDWDDNQKLKSLIEWIKQWESDGETVIDGIGSQMHISYYMNPQTQKSKEDHIVKMLQLMAASGKLCRITELDMGLVDENGNSVKSDDVTGE